MRGPGSGRGAEQGERRRRVDGVGGGRQAAGVTGDRERGLARRVVVGAGRCARHRGALVVLLRGGRRVGAGEESGVAWPGIGTGIGWGGPGAERQVHTVEAE